MPKKLKKSKPSIMKQKQVVNINITNPKRKAKRVKSKPTTKSSNLYPSQLQSHNSGVVLPFHHQFYIPPTDKSFPQIEELTNKFRDGNLMQITQNNDLMNRLDDNQRITNQLAQSVIKGKSPAKIYDLLMQEHLVRNAPKKLKHEIDEDGELWEEEVPLNKKSPIKLARGRGRPKNPLDEALPQEPSLIPKKSRGRPALSEEQKKQNKAERDAKRNSGAQAQTEEHKQGLDNLDNQFEDAGFGVLEPRPLAKPLDAKAQRTPIKLRARKKRVVINANI
jgi:hypothetical protein